MDDLHFCWKAHCTCDTLFNDSEEPRTSSLLEQLVTRLPELKPVTSTSDWEWAPRNAIAIAEVFPLIRIFGCSYIQYIWAKVKELGLAQDLKNKHLRNRSTQDY